MHQVQERSRPTQSHESHPAAPISDVKRAKQTAREWVEGNAWRWPGLRAAHLVGGVVAMPDDAPFPADKDVDLHLILDESSPMLADQGLELHILEEPYRGIALEAGLKSIADYRSPQLVLANPEIAHHLTLDCVLYDPEGLLHELQDVVRREYPRRRWVCARLEHERRGLAGAFDLLAMARERWGASGEVNILGYTSTFATAALWVATLSPLKMGGRAMLRLREVLAAYDRVDLQEELLAILGLTNIEPADVERFLQEATENFDLAVAIRETTPEIAQEFGPFQHKLHRHLRPYFIEACRGMLAEGYYREAMGWVVPYHLATADVLLAHGPEPAKAGVAARQATLLRALGLETVTSRIAAVELAKRLYDRIFVLAEEIVDNHPEVVD